MSDRFGVTDYTDGNKWDKTQYNQQAPLEISIVSSFIRLNSLEISCDVTKGPELNIIEVNFLIHGKITSGSRKLIPSIPRRGM